MSAYLKNMFDNSIRDTKQVYTRDASHLSFHCARRQILLPQTWNQYSGHCMHGWIEPYWC